MVASRYSAQINFYMIKIISLITHGMDSIAGSTCMAVLAWSPIEIRDFMVLDTSKNCNFNF
jgi:hypothetical protein